MMQTGVTARLRGISAVSDRVIWASGSDGTVIRTQDGGKSWKTLPVPGAETLDFRDIDAVDELTVYVLSVGNGDASRIFKTIDRGVTWIPQFRNQNQQAFFDAMAFSDPRTGFALSDAVDGQFVLIRTVDGGERWSRVPPETLPAPLAGEGAYAASGTNLAIQGNHIWFGTSLSRVLRSTDRGRTWAAATTPIPTGTSAGIFSIAFRDRLHGIVVGGDYKKENEAVDNAAVSDDGGATWTIVKGLGGFRSAVTVHSHSQQHCRGRRPLRRGLFNRRRPHLADVDGPGIPHLESSRGARAPCGPRARRERWARSNFRRPSRRWLAYLRSGVRGRRDGVLGGSDPMGGDSGPGLGVLSSAIAALVLVPWLLARGTRRRPTSSALWLALAGGSFFALDIALYNSAVMRTSAATASFLGNNAPIFVGLGTWWFFGQRPPAAYWAGLWAGASPAAAS